MIFIEYMGKNFEKCMPDSVRHSSLMVSVLDFGSRGQNFKKNRL